METQSTAKYMPISPQKVRLVCDQVRGMSPYEAESILKYMPQKGAGMILKVLRSAMANAENNLDLDPQDMYISAVYANEGPRRQWRRFGARGRFKPIIKRTSHITVVLSEREELPMFEEVEEEDSEEEQES